jgi:pyruvate,water dikinase
MKRASAIITDHGGRTSHAAIVSRELGLPAIVGTGNATHDPARQAGGDGLLRRRRGRCLRGHRRVLTTECDLDHVPAHRHRSCSISPTRPPASAGGACPPTASAWRGWNSCQFRRPGAPDGAGQFRQPEGRGYERGHRQLTRGYENKGDYFVETLARGLSRIAAVAYPNPVIVRMSDFKTNEYAELLGGHGLRAHEENPMIGLRGASRYYSDIYREAFALECKAINMLRERWASTTSWS